MTLRECNFEHLFGALVCGLKQRDGLEVFPGNHRRLDASITGLLVHIVSPVKFFTSMCALSSSTAASRISMHINRGALAGMFEEGSAPEAPLAQDSPTPSAVDGEPTRQVSKKSFFWGSVDGERPVPVSKKSVAQSSVDGERSFPVSKKSVARSSVDGERSFPVSRKSVARSRTDPSGVDGTDYSSPVSPKKSVAFHLT
jgi:hypothetical protein